MKVGDYVRTEDGTITRIKMFYERKWEEPELIYARFLCEDYEIYEYPRQVKSSSNIIELLKPMDLLYIDISPDDCGGIVVPRIPETLDELEKYIEKIKSGEYILKYVITHEQLENNMYKVGE